MVKVASEGFGKEISEVVRRWDLLDIDDTRLQKVVNIVMSNVNMFYLPVVFGVLRQSYCPLIVTPDDART